MNEPIFINTPEEAQLLRLIAQCLVNGDIQKMDNAYLALHNRLAHRLAQVDNEINVLFEHERK